MGKKNKPKTVTVQVIKSWNEGRVLMPGDRIELALPRAKKVEQLGYGVIIDPEAPYQHPATKKEHQFREVDFDKPEDVIPDKAKVELKKTIFKGEAEKIEPKSKGVLVSIPSLNDLTFTNKAHVKALKKSGIHVVPDIEGWDVDGLAMINGVSRKTAMKLLDAYNQYCNLDHHKDSDMEVKTK